MTLRTKVVRITLGLVTAITLLVGTWIGDDDNFPFGPFRMYSTKQELDGEVRIIEIYGLSRNGQWVKVLFNNFGLRRADVEGQLGKLAEPPQAILAEMFEAHDRIHAGPVPFEALQLRQRTYDLEDGRSVRELVETIGTWWAL